MTSDCMDPYGLQPRDDEAEGTGLPRFARSDDIFVHGSCAVSAGYGWLAMTIAELHVNGL